ncbi:coiled-coil domain-containing protein 42-like [Centropristis striata]|uniref:coiled-coil domain-containing protein 42-like n=1 Tax=Centropristis striata TaxID=184440 RepID=UPI0027E026C8|nr:coiled-coil domain-containing protein 42-like [Centropristis striata]XP_059193121.1 coiled-coil domain-containing protein 42-like [Centropristis striata]
MNRDSQRPPAGTSPLQTGHDTSFALLDLQQKRREADLLYEKLKERKQKLENLQQCADELEEEIKKVKEFSRDTLLKTQAADEAADRAERERKEEIRVQEDLERLKVECATLRETNEELKSQVDRLAWSKKFLEQVVKMTKFDDIEALTAHCENLLHFRDQLYRRESEALEQVDQERKALLTLEDKHHFLRLHKNNQLSKLQTELEETRSEAHTWERKWNHIQETAAKKTLRLGQIKIATLNLFEMIDDKVKDEEAVDINDTEKQLDQLKMFFQDHQDMVNKHQTPSQRHDGQKKDKRVVIHSEKKHS